MSEHRYLRLGLTGGIASGKSSVAGMFEKLGCGVVDADRCSRDVVLPGTEGHRRIREEFGEGVFLPDGTLDRSAMRALVFSDPQKRIQLESIVHPLVFMEVMCAMMSFESEGRPAGIVEAALIFEVSAVFGLDAVIAVVSGKEIQRRRLIARDHWGDAEIAGVLNAQMSDEERSNRADFIIRNEGTLQELEAGVRETWAAIRRKFQ